MLRRFLSLAWHPWLGGACVAAACGILADDWAGRILSPVLIIIGTHLFLYRLLVTDNAPPGAESESK